MALDIREFIRDNFGKDLSLEDIKKIKYLCKDIVDDAELYKINDGTSLMNLLLDKFNMNTTSDLKQLREVFSAIGNKTLEDESKKMLDYLRRRNTQILMAPGDFTLSKKSKAPTEHETSSNYQEPNTKQDSGSKSLVGEYKMEKEPRGKCIIINNRFNEKDGNRVKSEKGIELLPRKGTDVDSNRLKDLFSWLQFDVEVKNDVNFDEMTVLLQDLNKLVEQDDDCFIMCILSHGNKHGVYTNDGGFYCKTELRNMVSLKRCPKLVNKPKLFFIQACQGTKDDLYESDSPFTTTVKSAESDPPQNGPDNRPPQTNDTHGLSDILMFFATPEDFASYREPIKGALFIQVLCIVFEQYAEKSSVMEMAMKVIDEVQKEIVKLKVKQEYKFARQLPEPILYLTKHLFFKPKVGFQKFMQDSRENIPAEN